MPKPTVFICVPHSGSISPGTHRACVQPGVDFEPYGGKIYDGESPSLLAFGFNNLWCQALNSKPRPTYFVMLHSDLAPEPGWVDVLLKERQECGADILSVVSPIKDKRGLTSTGIHDPLTGRMAKFSTREALSFPKTFTADSIGYIGQSLLLNTGCWICDFTQPWVEQFGFQMRDRIVKDDDGKFIPQCLSEDWFMSVWAFRRGLKLAATTAVKMNHKGGFDFPNFVGWGSEMEDDEPGCIFGMGAANPEFELVN